MARKLLVMVATRKGAWLFHGDRRAGNGASTARIFSATSSITCVLDPRDGETLLAAAKTGHLGPTVFRSTDLGRTWKEATRPPAFAKAAEGEQGPRRRSHLLAHALPRQRTECLVRRHLAAGAVPLRRRRRHLGAVLLHQRRSAVPRVDGHGAGRHAGRAEAALDHRRPARSRAPVLRHVGRRRARVARWRPNLAPLVEGPGGGRGFRRRQHRRSTIRIACACARANPDRLYQQNHCGIYRLDRPSQRMDTHRPQHAEAGRRHRLSDGGAPARCRHRLGVPHGRHRPCGRAPARTASPAAYVTRNAGTQLAAAGRRPARRARPGGR